MVIGGRGWHQEEGKPARELLPGDVVEILPDTVWQIQGGYQIGTLFFENCLNAILPNYCL